MWPSPFIQVLAADWCKYNDCVLATGSVDKSIKLWDVRQPGRELAVMHGHRWVWVSIHGVDKSIKLWDVRQPGRELAVMHGHRWVWVSIHGVDKSIKLWDVRQPGRELAVMHGHRWVRGRVY